MAAGVADRDGWTCAVCWAPVERDERIRRWVASMDHVVPPDAGGTDTWDNAQLTHLVCNMDKSNYRAANPLLAFKRREQWYLDHGLDDPAPPSAAMIEQIKSERRAALIARTLARSSAHKTDPY